eukprot:m.1261946 g.1261946  ORF g.1261946 m.1261946 type:complete len:70 (-) comp24733_c0_seq29:1836-2045(-)
MPGCTYTQQLTFPSKLLMSKSSLPTCEQAGCMHTMRRGNLLSGVTSFFIFGDLPSVTLNNVVLKKPSHF